MLPAGPLMKEHRLIERMIALVAEKREKFEKKSEADPVFIEAAVDFIRTYADRSHHGKEEDILFRELKKKDMSEEHKKTMGELIEDHKYGRKVTGDLDEANASYRKGEEEALGRIKEAMDRLTELYPRHIEKEDERFFLPVMEYFDDGEKESMLEEMAEFDRGMLHRKYEDTVKKFEK
ncbi:MAG: cation-binding protein [Candidatus Omnitrophica bacterium]|nr:cation-binding protein [Candidatus Omnitrophota bacterium]